MRGNSCQAKKDTSKASKDSKRETSMPLGKLSLQKPSQAAPLTAFTILL